MKPASLRTRTAAAAFLVSTLTASLLVLGVAVLLSRSTDASIRSRLDARTAAASATVVDGRNGVRVLEQRSSLLDQNVWIFDSNGNLIDGRLPQGKGATTIRDLATGRAPASYTVGDVSYLARPVVRHGTTVATVVAAEDHDPYERAEANALWLSAALGIATVAIATVAAWMAATRSLRQVQEMADVADHMREHDVGQRFDPGPGGDEIAHLGRTLDQLLDRIADSLAAERRLTDEIAHELRTPLAVVLAEADLARAQPGGRDDPGLESIHSAAVTMRDSIDTMLAVARSHASTRREATVGELMETLGLPATSLDATALAAPVEPLAAAVRPLLDNALRHGSGEPRVEVRREGRGVILTVLDDGPGVDPADVERIFAPGHTTSPDGSGLGLALSRRMARAVGGEVTAKPGPGGRFDLWLPGR